MLKVIIKNFSVVLNIVLGVTTLHLISNRNDKQDYSSLNRQDFTEIVGKYTDTSGNEHVVNLPVVVSSDEINSIEGSNTYKLIDSLANELNITKKQLASASIVKISSNTVTKGELVDSVYIYKDSVINWSFNPALSILNFNANLKLTSVTYTDGKKFLGIPYGAKTIYNDVWISDSQKRFKINGVDNIIITNKIPTSPLTIAGKTEYRIKDNNLLFGPEFEFNNNKVSGYFSYLYSPQNDNWEPIVGIKYYLLK